MNVNRNDEKISIATGWSFATQIAAKILAPITNMILARIIAPEAFGILATINMVVSFADIFSTAGFHKYIVQHDFESEEAKRRSTSIAFEINAIVSLFLFTLICIFRDQISTFVGSEGYGLALCAASISIPIISLSSVYEALCQRSFDYKTLFIRKIAACAVPFVVTIPLALLGFEHWALIVGTVVSNLVILILLARKSEWKPKLIINYSESIQLFNFGKWMLLEAFLLWATSYIDILIISNSLGDYYTGLYKNSQQTVTGILTIITSATTSVIFAALSRVQNDQVAFENVFYKFQNRVALFVIPLGLGMFCFSDLVTWVLLGPNWMEASSFVGIWGLCTSCVCVWSTFVREAYRAKGKPKLSVLAQFLHVVFVVPVCWFGVKAGFSTLVYVRSFAFLQIIVVNMIIMKIFMKMSPMKMIWDVQEYIIAGVIMFGVGALLKLVSDSYLLQFLWISICIVVYFSVLMLFPKRRKEMIFLAQGLREKIKTKAQKFKR